MKIAAFKFPSFSSKCGVLDLDYLPDILWLQQTIIALSQFGVSWRYFLFFYCIFPFVTQLFKRNLLGFWWELHWKYRFVWGRNDISTVLNFPFCEGTVYFIYYDDSILSYILLSISFVALLHTLDDGIMNACTLFLFMSSWRMNCISKAWKVHRAERVNTDKVFSIPEAYRPQFETFQAFPLFLFNFALVCTILAIYPIALPPQAS